MTKTATKTTAEPTKPKRVRPSMSKAAVAERAAAASVDQELADLEQARLEADLETDAFTAPVADDLEVVRSLADVDVNQGIEELQQRNRALGINVDNLNAKRLADAETIVGLRADLAGAEARVALRDGTIMLKDQRIVELEELLEARQPRPTCCPPSMTTCAGADFSPAS